MPIYHTESCLILEFCLSVSSSQTRVSCSLELTEYRKIALNSKAEFLLSSGITNTLPMHGLGSFFIYLPGGASYHTSFQDCTAHLCLYYFPDLITLSEIPKLQIWKQALIHQEHTSLLNSLQDIYLAETVTQLEEYLPTIYNALSSNPYHQTHWMG